MFAAARAAAPAVIFMDEADAIAPARWVLDYETVSVVISFAYSYGTVVSMSHLYGRGGSNRTRKVGPVRKLRKFRQVRSARWLLYHQTCYRYDRLLLSYGKVSCRSHRLLTWSWTAKSRVRGMEFRV